MAMSERGMGELPDVLEAWWAQGPVELEGCQ